MKVSYDYPPGELYPRKLTRQQIDAPHEVIEAFFDFAKLPQVRDMLWQWLETTVTGSFPKTLDTQEKSNLLFFYQQLEKLIEAAHIMHSRGGAKSKKKKKMADF